MTTTARRTLPNQVAYALAASVIGLGLFASITPSPLYRAYAALWHFSPLTLTLIYATYMFGVLTSLLLVLFVTAFIGAYFMPEPVAERHPFRLTVERPKVPRAVRRPFLLAALAVVSSWSIAGLFFSLGPALSAHLFNTHNVVVSAIGIVAIGGTGALSQLAFGRTAPWLSRGSS